GTYGKPGPAVDLTLGGPGYRAHALLPAGYADNAPQLVAFTPPRQPLIGRLCLRQRGRRPLQVLGTPESRAAHAQVDGRRIALTPAVQLYEARDRTPLGRVGAGARHAADFLPGWAAPALLIALLVLGTGGVVVGVGWALWAA